MRAVRAAANKTNNPSLKGWAFELEQIDLIHSSLVSGDSRPEYVTNEKGLVFRPTSEHVHQLPSLFAYGVSRLRRTQRAFIITRYHNSVDS